MEDLFKGNLLKLDKKMLLFKSQEMPARPFWAYQYSNVGQGQCKGQAWG